MISLDHEQKRGSPYCPLMREDCCAGSTKSMKGRKCAAWRSLPMFDRVSGMTKEISACSSFEWPPALGYEASGVLQQTRASVDKVANETRLVAAVAAGGQQSLEKALTEAKRTLSLEQK